MRMRLLKRPLTGKLECLKHSDMKILLFSKKLSKGKYLNIISNFTDRVFK